MWMKSGIEINISLVVDKDGDGNNLLYMCKYCKSKLLEGKVPPSCILNESGIAP